MCTKRLCIIKQASNNYTIFESVVYFPKAEAGSETDRQTKGETQTDRLTDMHIETDSHSRITNIGYFVSPFFKYAFPT